MFRFYIISGMSQSSVVAIVPGPITHIFINNSKNYAFEMKNKDMTIKFSS